jgi:hypothetical protein
VGAALPDMVANALPRLEAMGFALQSVSTYGAEFLRGGNLLRLETEPHYPGLSASIKTGDGSIFELGALAETIDPDWYATYRQHSSEGGPHRLNMILDFLDIHSDQIFHRQATFESRYRQLVAARMRVLGLEPR